MADVTLNLDHETLYLLLIFFISEQNLNTVMKEACLAILEGEELEGVFASVKLQGMVKTLEACLNKASDDEEFKVINENFRMCPRVFYCVKYVV